MKAYGFKKLGKKPFEEMQFPIPSIETSTEVLLKVWSI